MNHGDDNRNRHRLFIVDDHPLVRNALKAVLSYEPGLEVVGDAASAEDTLARLDHQPPDLYLIDFSLPGMDGVELIRRLVRIHPDTPCLMVSSHHERFYVDAALAAGARGYVLKGEPDALLRAVIGVLRGETVVETE